MHEDHTQTTKLFTEDDIANNDGPLAVLQDDEDDTH